MFTFAGIFLPITHLLRASAKRSNGSFGFARVLIKNFRLSEPTLHSQAPFYCYFSKCRDE